VNHVPPRYQLEPTRHYAQVFPQFLQERDLEQSLARVIVSSEKLGELCAMHERRSVNKICTVFVKPAQSVAYDTLPFDYSSGLPEKVVYSDICHLYDSSGHVHPFHKSLYRDGVYVEDIRG
jgi:hypothetical protein